MLEVFFLLLFFLFLQVNQTCSIKGLKDVEMSLLSFVGIVLTF